MDTNLQPVLNFYIDAIGSKEGALALVIQFTSLFSYSPENRLKPRLEQAKEVGNTIDTAQ